MLATWRFHSFLETKTEVQPAKEKVHGKVGKEVADVGAAELEGMVRRPRLEDMARAGRFWVGCH